ncbi:type VI secretion system-associated FHA domain protein TagH [Microbulbifer agarilyticus]
MDLLLAVTAAPEGTNMLKHTKLFTRNGGSFGRADSNDWALPDPQRVVSSRHGEIVFADGAYVLLDHSTNGTYLNQSADPVGKGNRISLNDGDVVGVGDYQLKVTIRQAKTDSELPKGLGGADFLDSADRTTFSASAAAKMQSAKDAQELDSWLEPGAATPNRQSGEWGYLAGGSASTPNAHGDDFLGQELLTDPLQVLNQGASSQGNELLSAIAPSEFGASGGLHSMSPSAPSSDWGDDDAWWKDGSEQDHAPAHNHAMQIPNRQQPQVPPSSPDTSAPPQQQYGESDNRPALAKPEQVASSFAGADRPNMLGADASTNPFAESFSAVAQEQISGTPGFPGMEVASASDRVAVEVPPQSQIKGAEPNDLAPTGPVPRGSVPHGVLPNSTLPSPSPAKRFTQDAERRSSPTMAATEAPEQVVSNPSNSQTLVQSDASTVAAHLGLKLPQERLMHLDEQAAAIVEESIGRLIDLLRARNSIKNELRVQRTMIQTAANNPLKFSATAKDAMDAMFAANGAFMDPVEAVGDSFDDLSDHQVAVLSGMRAGYEAMLRFFSPENIERRGGASTSVFSSKNSRSWENYVNTYRDLVSDPDSCYKKLFGEEFALTYENQLSELKNARKFSK